MVGGTAGGGVSPIPREARAWQGYPAGLVTRLAAATIDIIVVALVLLAGYFGLVGLLFLVDPRDFSLPDVGLFLSLVAAYCVAVPYLTLSWTISGRTYGYLVLGLRVLGRGDEPLGFVGSAVRAVFVAFVPIGVLWVLVSRENRSIQDVVLGTAVVYDWQPRMPRGHIGHADDDPDDTDADDDDADADADEDGQA